MMQKVLVSGSLAYDHIDKNKTVYFGGCGGNIVYNARLLNEDFILLGIAGKNFGEYKIWLHKNKIDTRHVIIEKKAFTSKARMTTLKTGRQMASFYPCAAAFSKYHKKKIEKSISRLAPTLACVLISPNDREFMMATLSACRKNRIPYFFDPGQAMMLFSKNELYEIIQQSSGLFLNDHEANLLKRILHISQKTLCQLVPLLIITKGAEGSSIFWHNREIKIPTKRIKKPLDPTGCGDAYRAGFLAMIKNHFPKLSLSMLKRAGHLGTRLALACLQQRGTQNHRWHS